MTKKIDEKKKIGSVDPSDRTREVTKATAVGGVEGVKPAGSIGGVGKAGGISRRGATRTMTLAEREELFRMINEEADKMLAESGMSDSKKAQVVKAVKMAIDSTLIDEEESDGPGDDKKA